jgi:hypothetical protein
MQGTDDIYLCSWSCDWHTDSAKNWPGSSLLICLRLAGRLSRAGAGVLEAPLIPSDWYISNFCTCILSRWIWSKQNLLHRTGRCIGSSQSLDSYLEVRGLNLGTDDWGLSWFSPNGIMKHFFQILIYTILHGTTTQKAAISLPNSYTGLLFIIIFPFHWKLYNSIWNSIIK